MNEVIKKDYRKKDNLKWLNDNYFIAIYDNNDNYITAFENVESIGHAFNISLSKILKYIRYNINFEYKGSKFKLFLYKKDPIKENIERRRK